MIKPTPFRRMLFFILFDVIISFFTLLLAYNLRFNFEVPSSFMEGFISVFCLIVGLKIAMMGYFKIYHVSWRFFSLVEARKLLISHVFAYGTFVIVFFFFGTLFNPFARSIIIIDFFISLLIIGALRILKRVVRENSVDTSKKKTVIIGATPFAQAFLKNQNQYYVVAILDDFEMLVDTYLSDMRVQHLDTLRMLCQKEEIKSAIITKEYGQKEINQLFEELQEIGVNDIKIASLHEKQNDLKDLSVEDLLARRPKDLDTKVLHSFLKNKKVLVTGAGGSIGSEICQQCLHYGVQELIMVDNSEFNLYRVNEKLQPLHVKPILLSVLDHKKLESVFEQYCPHIVIHAAAYKHVPMCEDNPAVAIENNILGTKNVIDLAIAFYVQKVVLISTDKAVRPTSIMGATKRVCELYAGNVPSGQTEIVTVRFGNVLDSSGSVIPKFRKLIEENKPLTVTHPEITRYFMLVSEACQLVLQAAAIAKGGELFVLDMGEPVRIDDLAKRMLQLYGKEELGIEYIGLRSGEKLYEELLINESDKQTKYESIFVASSTPYDIVILTTKIEGLLSSDTPDKELHALVPEFILTKNTATE